MTTPKGKLRRALLTLQGHMTGGSAVECAAKAFTDVCCLAPSDDLDYVQAIRVLLFTYPEAALTLVRRWLAQ